MKVIQIDNYNREGPEGNDELICEGVSEYWGKIILEYLKNRNGNGMAWFRLVSDDYELQIFEP